ncbi:MAG: hypothetical protein JSS60_06060 [Verrucomicrobia bacterium]|nr:hypothetical protein [Verrucomicrobiota bacterium]
MPLSPELKNSLIATAVSLREGDERSALHNFRRVCAQSPDVANLVYGRLWEVMHRPTFHTDFGRAAFWNQDGLTAPLAKKTRAIEEVLKSLIQESRVPLQAAPLPPGAKEVNIPSFFDCGFDPRFSTEGDYLLPPQESSSGWLSETIQEWTAYIEFLLRAYFSSDPEERAVRQMILSCSKAERAWGTQTSHTFTEDYEGIHTVFALEHDFLNQASEFYKKTHPGSCAATDRLYPSELLRGLHHIYKPQADYWSAQAATPDWENGDLSRCGSWGLWRLREEMYTVYNERERRMSSLDRQEFRYVPHYLFIHATAQPASELKTALRQYRAELAAMIIDQKCARSFAACKEKLMPKMQAFHSAWESFAKSHELMKEANAVFSKEDHYKPMYDQGKWEAALSQIPFFEKLYEAYNIHFHSHSNYWHDYYMGKGYASLKQSMQRDFPASPSARLLRSVERPRR